MKAILKRWARTRYALALRRAWQRVFRWRWFRGDFATWAEARAASVGYEDGAVLRRVRAATRAVRAGAAAWERDGMLFTEPVMHASLLAALRAAAGERGTGALDVVDFGGALGSTWWQHRAALRELRVHWCVVEQPEFVAAGREEFTGEGLTFEPTLAAACAQRKPAVILFSGVLQYVERPDEFLRQAVSSGATHIIIDRLPCWSGGRNWLAVQHTMPELGGGSYPAWIFDRVQFLAPLVEKFECVTEWPGLDEVDRRVTFSGLHLVRKEGRA